MTTRFSRANLACSRSSSDLGSVVLSRGDTLAGNGLSAGEMSAVGYVPRSQERRRERFFAAIVWLEIRFICPDARRRAMLLYSI